MNRCILTVITAFVVTSSFAQSDFIQLKKNNKVLQTWFKGDYIYAQLKNGQWINAEIYKIQDDSLYLRPFTVRTYFVDTTFYGLLTIHINYLMAFPREDKGFSYVKNGTIFIIGGGGYLLLNVINTLSNNEPVFGSDNLPNVAIATAVLALGVALKLTHKSIYTVGKKYHVEYISSKPSS